MEETGKEWDRGVKGQDGPEEDSDEVGEENKWGRRKDGERA